MTVTDAAAAVRDAAVAALAEPADAPETITECTPAGSSDDVGISAVARLMVSVRIRPLSQKELAKDNVTAIATSPDDKTVVVYDPNDDFLEDILRKDRQREKYFAFDNVFSESASQDLVFDKTVRHLIDSVLHGFNATVFAYGATGAGKTYTMMGTEACPGIMVLTLADLFAKIAGDNEGGAGSFEVVLSYLEIYNENIRDLLSGKPDYLELREDAVRGVVVAGIMYVPARSPEEVLAFLRKGNKNRCQEATGANEVSSRSHAILQVFVTHRTVDQAGGQNVHRFAKLSMIDLAGSERAAETNNRGIRMLEGANINRSLLALGNCINSLIEPGRKNKYVNYRDSKLTRLLKDSLGGNCRTVMIANISPASSHFDETLNTLKYASRARTIKTKITQQVSFKYDVMASTLQHLQQIWVSTSLSRRCGQGRVACHSDGTSAAHVCAG
ncbi:P-loop containing nucleoside triphosphate hydrolase protein [Entophlyctis helioformis]|nr:P-loop containing nucleoside triphosphate hydrolase protein [Entophlyctis helioformis]